MTMRLFVKTVYFAPVVIPKIPVKGYLPLVIGLATIFSFWRLGNHSVNSYDEARLAVNAYEMMHNGDCINLYYDNQPDPWNAKPPMMIWLIVASYTLFGFSELALRLPSALAAVVFFYFTFRIITLYEKPVFAFFVCLALIGSKAMIAPHAGRAGDFDALFVLLLTITTWHFLRFIDLGKKQAVFKSALFLGLAFYAKGPACLLVLPGFFFYALIRHRLKPVFSDMRFYLASLVFLAIAGSWILLLYRYGKPYHETYYGSKNALETMLVEDVVNRYTQEDFKSGNPYDPLKPAKILDVRMNLWNYLFYVSLVIAAGVIWRKNKHPAGFERYFSSSLVAFSFCMSLSIYAILTVAEHIENWYIIPALPYFMIIASKGVFWLGDRYRTVKTLVAGLLLFVLARHFHFITVQDSGVRLLIQQNKSLWADIPVVYFLTENQAVRTYMLWQGKETHFIKNDSSLAGVPRPFLLYAAKYYASSQFPSRDTFAIRNEYLSVVHAHPSTR